MRWLARLSHRCSCRIDVLITVCYRSSLSESVCQSETPLRLRRGGSRLDQWFDEQKSMRGLSSKSLGKQTEQRAKLMSTWSTASGLSGHEP